MEDRVKNYHSLVDVVRLNQSYTLESPCSQTQWLVHSVDLVVFTSRFLFPLDLTHLFPSLLIVHTRFVWLTLKPL